MRRRHYAFQFSVFSFQFICVADTTLLRQNFVMPRLCYGSAEQLYLPCSHLNRKVHLSHFSFYFINTRRRHLTFHFSVFTFQFICVADTFLFTFHFSLFTFHFSVFTFHFTYVSSPQGLCSRPPEGRVQAQSPRDPRSRGRGYRTSRGCGARTL